MHYLIPKVLAEGLQLSVISSIWLLN